MLGHEYLFQGAFNNKCQEESIPPSLLALITMILNQIGVDSGNCPTQAALTISQLLQFNVAAKSKH